MEKNELLAMPYKPSWIHRFFAWVDRLPVPAWSFYLFILVLGGVIRHLVAWNTGILEQGQFNLYFALAQIWLVEQLYYYGHLNPRIARQALDDIRPLLDMDEEGFNNLVYEFTMTPASKGRIFQVLGFSFGIAFAAVVRPFSPEINYSFPEYVFLSWGLAQAMTFLSIYWIFRQLGLVKEVFGKLKRVDLYDLDSLYGLSRLTASMGVAIIVIAFLNMFIITPQQMESALAVIFYTVFLILALVVFVLPLTDVNRFLREEKKRLLKVVNTHLEDAFEKVRKDFRSNQLEHMPALQVAIDSMMREKNLLESTPTWPWAPSTFRGFLAAIFLPLFLWLLQQLLARFMGF
jgi:hypothetical protein